MKTMVLPAILCSINALCDHLQPNPPPLQVALALASAFIFIWIHLLVFNIQNQMQDYSIAEDRTNKPWRPLPSGRISTAGARRAFTILLLSAIILSFHFGALLHSLIIHISGFLYNKTHLHQSAIARNLLCAIAYLLAGSGCSLVAINTYTYTHHPSHIFDPSVLTTTTWSWLLIFACVVFSTIQVSDIPDTEGDSKLNRRTLPVVLGIKQTSSFSSLIVASWSLALAFAMIPAHPVCVVLCVGLGGWVSGLLWRCRGDGGDVMGAYVSYTGWLAFVAFLPVLVRV